MDALTTDDFRQAAQRTGAYVCVGCFEGQIMALVIDNDGFEAEAKGDTPRGALERAIARWFEVKGEGY